MEHLIEEFRAILKQSLLVYYYGFKSIRAQVYPVSQTPRALWRQRCAAISGRYQQSEHDFPEPTAACPHTQFGSP